MSICGKSTHIREWETLHVLEVQRQTLKWGMYDLLSKAVRHLRLQRGEKSFEGL